MNTNTAEVSLPDGTVVNIETKEGIDALMNGVSSFDYFSSSLKEIRNLRKKKRLNARDEKKLIELHSLISNIAIFSDGEVFRAKIPASEIQDWLNYVIEELQTFTKKPSWINSGYLNKNDYYVLISCEVMFSRSHAVPVCSAFESDFFQVLANFIKAVKGELPHHATCLSVVLTVSSCLHTALEFFDNCWSLEKIFKKFEASGILEQILRFSTVSVPREVLASSPDDHSELFDNLDMILKALGYCVGFMTRKFKTGTPCGDTLKSILDGQDESMSIQPEILNRLQNIARLVEFMDSSEFYEASAGVCISCGKLPEVVGATLLCCAGCRLTYYCSKECQRTDWKNHKPKCKKHPKLHRERTASCHSARIRFLKKNWKTVTEEIKKKRDSTGLTIGDLAVLVDLTPDEDGTIPGLKDPPVFDVLERISVAQYLDDSQCKPTSTPLILCYGGYRVVSYDPQAEYQIHSCSFDHASPGA